MFEIDRAKIGGFVRQLRREQNLTQRELAQRLYISDKAVSKWETGASLPDTAMLLPLAEQLGVTVAELLRGERLSQNMNAQQVEELVQAAVNYGEIRPKRSRRRGQVLAYALSLALGCIWALLLHGRGWLTESALSCMLLGAVFGAYFSCFALCELPARYEGAGWFRDGPLRMNLVGIRLNQRKWTGILRVGRIWGCLSMALLPGILLLGRSWGLGERAMDYGLLALTLGGLFVPIYAIGLRK